MDKSGSIEATPPKESIGLGFRLLKPTKRRLVAEMARFRPATVESVSSGPKTLLLGRRFKGAEGRKFHRPISCRRYGGGDQRSAALSYRLADIAAVVTLVQCRYAPTAIRPQFCAFARVRKLRRYSGCRPRSCAARGGFRRLRFDGLDMAAVLRTARLKMP